MQVKKLLLVPSIVLIIFTSSPFWLSQPSMLTETAAWEFKWDSTCLLVYAYSLSKPVVETFLRPETVQVPYSRVKN